MKYFNTPVQRDENIHIGKIILSFCHYKRYFVIAILSAIVLTALMMIFVPKQYDIEGRLRLISNKSGMGSELKALKSSALGGMLGGGSGSGFSAEDEAMVILSRRILSQTIEENLLQVGMTSWEGIKKSSFYGDEAPYKLTFSKGFLGKIPEVISIKAKEKNGETKFAISSKSIGERSIEAKNLPATISTLWGEIIIEKGNKWKNDSKVIITLSPIPMLFEFYQKALTVRPAEQNSDILQLAINDDNCQRGVQLINSLMHNYIKYTKSIKLQESELNEKFVEEKLQEVTTTLNQLEKGIETYKRQNKIPELGAYGAVTYSGSESTYKQLLDMQTQTKMLDYAIDYLKDSKNEYAIAPNIDYGTDAISAYNQLMFRRLELLNSSEATNPAVETINEQLREQRKVLISTLQTARRNMNIIINDIHKENRTLNARLQELPSQEKEYIEMKRLQSTKEALYLFLLQKKQEKEVANAPDEQAARILDNAYTSYRHVFPKGSIMLPVFLIVCLFIAFTAAAIKEFILKKTISQDELSDLLDVTPWGTFKNSESAKRLRRLIYDRNDQGGIFLITSSSPEEGKSFFTQHIVESLNETDRKATSIFINPTEKFTPETLNKQIQDARTNHKYVFIKAPSLNESSISYEISQITDYTFFLCRLGVTTKNDISNLNQEINLSTLGKVAVVVNHE